MIFGVNKEDIEKILQGLSLQIKQSTEESERQINILSSKIVALENRNTSNNEEMLMEEISILSQNFFEMKDLMLRLVDVVRNISSKHEVVESPRVAEPPRDSEKLDEIENDVNSIGVKEEKKETTYCVFCKDTREIIDGSQFTTKKGRDFLKGQCSGCGNALYKYLNKSNIRK